MGRIFQSFHLCLIGGQGPSSFAGLEFQVELHFHHIIFNIQSPAFDYSKFFILVGSGNEFSVVFSQLGFVYNVPLCNVSVLKIAYHL